MKKSELFFTFILVPIDILMIILAFTLAYFYRSQADVIYIWPYDQYRGFVFIITPFWILIFALAGLYKIRKNERFSEEFASIALAVSSGIMLIVAWIFLSKTDFFSRLVVIYAWIFALIFVLCGRVIVRLIQNFLFRFGVGVHRLAIIGEGETADLVIREIQGNKNLNYRVVGIIKTRDLPNKKKNSKTLGDISKLSSILDHLDIDDVILADPSIPDKQVVNIINICHDRKVIFKQIPNLFQMQTANVHIASLKTVPIIEFLITPLEGWGKIIKRTMDIIGAIIGIIIFSPVMLIIAILIKLDSKGPVIYKNERVGEGDKKFMLYKFRSMKLEYCTGSNYGGKCAEEYEKKLIRRRNERIGPVYKVLSDPRRTKLGRFIERTSLDEFPQFFNVILGNISLVGPRPHQPREVSNYEGWHRKVLRIKPGVTGMAQISGRSDLNFDDEARLDIYYIENWSLWLDIQILFKTPFAVIRPRKAV